jgi:hypothetical protein
MVEKRQSLRFPLRMPVLCENPPVHSYRTLGFTQNVSRGGLLLEVSQPLTLGTSTGLRLLAGDGIVRAQALVVWTAESPIHLTGLRLTMMTGGDTLAWEQLLAFQAGPVPRGSLRVPIDLEVTCLIPPDTRVRGRVKNLSDSGMMIILPRALPPQSRVSVVVPAWLGLPPVDAEVVWTRASSALYGPVHGLHFTTNDMYKDLFLMGTLLRQLLY